MRQLLFLLTVIGLTACFDDGKDTKTVKVVDTRKDGVFGSTTPQAVSDSDFKALQDKVKTLETKLAALDRVKSDVTALQSDVAIQGSSVSSLQSDVAIQGSSVSSLQSTVTNHGSRLTSAELSINSQVASISSLNTTVSGHDSELTALTSSVNGLVAQPNLKQNWLYDGNHVKRHKVVTVYDRSAWQEAMVEITTGVNARFQLGRFADANPQEAPTPQVMPTGVVGGSIFYSFTGCTGTAMVGDTSTGADYGQATSLGGYVSWVTSSTQRLNGYSYESVYDGTSCSNGAGGPATKASVAVVQLKSLYSYPNPLTVGP